MLFSESGTKYLLRKNKVKNSSLQFPALNYASFEAGLTAYVRDGLPLRHRLPEYTCWLCCSLIKDLASS